MRGLWRHLASDAGSNARVALVLSQLQQSLRESDIGLGGGDCAVDIRRHAEVSIGGAPCLAIV